MNRREKHAQRRRIVDAIQWAIEASAHRGNVKPYDVAISVLSSLDGAGFRVQRKRKPPDQYEHFDRGLLMINRDILRKLER